MAANIPGSLLNTTRTPLDDKYWIQTFSNIDSGLTFQGLIRFIRGDDTLWIKLSTGWAQIPLTSEQTRGTTSITIGRVTEGDTASVRNVGTDSAPILDFVLPRGNTGQAATFDIERVETSPDDLPHIRNLGDSFNASYVLQIPKGPKGDRGAMFTINAQGTFGGRSGFDGQPADFVYLVNEIDHEDDGYIYIKTSTGWSNRVAFRGLRGAQGKSIFLAYSRSSDGLNPTFILDTDQKFMSIINSDEQPQIEDFEVWIPISVSSDSKGSFLEEFGDSSEDGLSQKFITEQLQYDPETDSFPGRNVGGITTSFNRKGKSLMEILNKLLEAEFINANSSISGGGLYEKGISVTVSLNASYAPNSEVIIARRIKRGNTIIASPTTNSAAIVDPGITVQTLYTAEIDVMVNSVTQTRVSNTAVASFIAPSFYAIVPSLSPSEANLKAGIKDITTSGSFQTNLANNNQRIGVAYPSTLGSLTSIKDSNGFEYISSFTKSTQSYSLANGNAEPYFLYVLTLPAGDGSAFTFTYSR